MPSTSPRRSSRSHLPETKRQNSGGSSSMSSSKIEHITRSHNRNDGNGASGTPRSASSADSEGKDRSEPDARRTRQQQREQDVKEDTKIANEENAPGEEGTDDEDEVTRCICKKLEYPGPPVPLNDSSRPVKDPRPSAGGASDGLADEPGSLFIQCETCNVWQHGGCVGIMDENESPDNYWCELCRADLHKVFTGPRGQKYSRYLPVTDPKAVRKKPVAKEVEGRPPKDPNSKHASNATLSNGKRRSTMNSRTAWEEEENFRRAVEASKGSDALKGLASSSKGNKRSREESEDEIPNIKRRRTGSAEPSESHADVASGESDSEADESRNHSRPSNSVRKARSAAAQALHEKEIRQREKDKERERLEAASKRKGRAERRRADEESEPPEEPTKPSATSRSTSARTAKPAVATTPQAETTPTPPAKPVVKKNIRAPVKRSKLGRNQHTRERDALADAAREGAARTARGEEAGNGDIGSIGQVLSNGTKPAKPRHINPKRTSLNEMKKRAAGIAEFISQVQRDMAGERSLMIGSSSNGLVNGAGGHSEAKAGPGKTNGASKLSKEIREDQEQESTGQQMPASGTTPERPVEETENAGSQAMSESREKVDEEVFSKLSAMEMMDVLSREVTLWQKDHGKYREG